MTQEKAWSLFPYNNPCGSPQPSPSPSAWNICKHTAKFLGEPCSKSRWCCGSPSTRTWQPGPRKVLLLDRRVTVQLPYCPAHSFGLWQEAIIYPKALNTHTLPVQCALPVSDKQSSSTQHSPPVEAEEASGLVPVRWAHFSFLPFSLFLHSISHYSSVKILLSFYYQPLHLPISGPSSRRLDACSGGQK